MPNTAKQAPIQTRPCPSCTVCGAAGDLLYADLEDVLFGAPGLWSVRRCTNAACGLIWLDPQPTEDDIGKAYATYFTHEAAGGGMSLPKRVYRTVKSSYLSARLGYRGSPWLAPLGVAYPGGGDALAASVMFLRAPAPGDELLDVGCGAGDFLAVMRDLGWKARGVETDPQATRRGRERGLDIHEGDLASASFPDRRFDAVTMAHVIEHVHDAPRLLAECARILKPGGTLVILTPNSDGWGHRRFGRDWLSLDPPRHIRLFNRDNLRRLLEGAGLQPRRVATLAINASAVWPASAAVRRTRSLPPDARGVVRLRSTPGGIARQMIERALLIADPRAGEDLLAIATARG
jgi:SAM-dependent methyltransferase